ncbi:endonuclease/exonuclease/phosphatase family protein [Spirosoma terrae]|uniref:Endonuclease/exonuclease/phosphatase family protein n=1 Tax=Spirosoma terrae TaxID=1968276 RepID=A0A6L9L9W0_9BACT|nr:endonuclease/exonuclease/phosphatase family protein [Spirosoma terrae]NDU96257.1 endonuclease/exonuclease/phosphatase family protein [Spirosoma terrae]
MTVSAPRKTRNRFRSRSPFVSPQWLNKFLIILSLGLFSCSLTGQLLGKFYFFELFSHFVIQYEWVAYGLLGLWALYWVIFRYLTAWSVGAALLVGITAYGNHTAWMPGDYAPDRPIKRGEVRVLHANVLYSREEYVTTVAMVKKQQPDLYVLQEMTPDPIRWVTSQLRSEYPYWFACRSKQQVWTLVGSRTRFKVDEALARRLHIISLETTINGKPVALLTVHPHTPVYPSWFRERNEQLAYSADKTRTNTLPTLLIGDFNISMFSPIYASIFEPVNAPRPLIRARRDKTQPTWPRFLPPMMIPIDHAFVNDGFNVLSFQTMDQTGSDHRAVVVDLDLLRR